MAPILNQTTEPAIEIQLTEILRQRIQFDGRLKLVIRPEDADADDQDERLDDAGMALTRLYTALRGVEIKDIAIDEDYGQRFKAAMDDDFNTPVALSVLFDCARELNKTKDSDPDKASMLAVTLKALAGVLGIIQGDPQVALQTGFRLVTDHSDIMDELSDEKIEQQVNERLKAKKDKDWVVADKIRDALKDQGVVLEDVAGGTNWRRE